VSVQALVLTQTTGGVTAAKQLKACWDYITAEEHLRFGGLLLQGAGATEAAAAVKAGDVQVVVAAYRVADMHLTGEIEAVGGTVEYVHKEPASRLTVRSVLASLYRRLGWSATRIAREVGGDTDDVMDHLRRAGIPKPRRRE
jgi:hypothetical protein